MRTQQRVLLTVEPLEDRCVPAVYEVPWPDPQHLTLSFVQDGTPIRDQVSNLYQFLNAQAPTATWQREILRAFQTWAVNANVNLGLVADGGQPLGAPGAVQGDARFGDVRIAAWNTGTSQLSTATPFQWTGTTWAGDVLLNNQADLGVNGVGGFYDLFTLALHEAGHSFGFASVNDPASIMNANYTRAFTGLPAADVAHFQALFGSRSADAFDAQASNNTWQTATNLGIVTTTARLEADVTTNQDVDFYRVTAPSLLGLTGLTVRLQTKGISLLAPQVTIYDGAMNVVGTASATDLGGGDLTLTVTSSRLLNTTYYIKVSGATQDVFGIGGYRLGASFQVGPIDLGNLPGLIFTDDGHTNDSLSQATNLSRLFVKGDGRFDYLYRGNVRDGSDTDYYQIRSPGIPNATSVAMTAIVWGADANGLQPQLHLFDVTGRPVPFQVVTNGQGTFTLQLDRLTPYTTYYLQVSSGDPGGPHGTGNYTVGVNFSRNALVSPDQLASNTLARAGATDAGQLVLADARLFHFVLAAQAGQPTGGSVVMDVVDPQGRTVVSLEAAAGKAPVSATLYLAPGAYTVRLTARSASGAQIPPLTYYLYGALLSDNSGPYYTSPNDPNGTGPASPPPNGGYTYSRSTTASATYAPLYYY